MVASFTAQGTYEPTGLIVGHDDTQTREITLAAGQNLKRGSLLGRITASGAYVLSLSAATDGSQSPSVILAEDTDASGSAKDTVAYFGGVFDENYVIFGTGRTPANSREALRSIGIKLQSSIVG